MLEISLQTNFSWYLTLMNINFNEYEYTEYSTLTVSLGMHTVGDEELGTTNEKSITCVSST